MEEEALQPYLDYEAPWEQELRTLERKLAAEAQPPTDAAEAAPDACPCDPAALVSMAAREGGVQDRAELARVVVAFTDEDNETLMTLPRRQCLQPHSHSPSSLLLCRLWWCSRWQRRLTDLVDNQYAVLCSLVDILYGYAFDARTTLGDATVESAWTVAKLSRTLCWLDAPPTVRDAALACVHRALAFPVFRNWRLACRVLGDVCALLRLGRRAVLRALLAVRRVFAREYGRQYLNTLYIEPYAVWVQGVDDATLAALAAELERAAPAKHDVRWDLAEIEALARADGFRPDDAAERPSVL